MFTLFAIIVKNIIFLTIGITNRDCTTNEFKCGNGGGCINSTLHCNGYDDCFDGSDEVGCRKYTIYK